MLQSTPEEAITVGATMRAAREGAGLSLRETARRLGVTHATLSRFERGQRVVSAETLTRLRDVILDETKRGAP